MPKYPPVTTGTLHWDKPATGPFSIQKHKQPPALTRVFQDRELCTKILEEVAHRWGDLRNLSRTCQLIMSAIHQIPVSPFPHQRKKKKKNWEKGRNAY